MPVKMKQQSNVKIAATDKSSLREKEVEDGVEILEVEKGKSELHFLKQGVEIAFMEECDRKDTQLQITPDNHEYADHQQPHQRHEDIISRNVPTEHNCI
eukprot:13201391-Ditylum_brightwellii.AAC.1